MHIIQSAFIRDLEIGEKLIDYNTNVIFIKAKPAIEMTNSEDYKETELQKYQRLISKFIYLASETKPNIAFTVSQLSKYNTNLKKGHL